MEPKMLFLCIAWRTFWSTFIFKEFTNLWKMGIWCHIYIFHLEFLLYLRCIKHFLLTNGLPQMCANVNKYKVDYRIQRAVTITHDSCNWHTLFSLTNFNGWTETSRKCESNRSGEVACLVFHTCKQLVMKENTLSLLDLWDSLTRAGMTECF